jgi:threonyl-tRNA synthetase
MNRKTAREILEAQGKLDKDVIAVKSGDHVYDLMTPLTEETQKAGLTPIRATEPAGLAVIRHSTAHVMADAVQRLFPGTKVTIGPAIEDGFYYDFDKQDGAFSEEDLAKIEAVMQDIIDKNTPFRREVISRDGAVDMFEKMGERFKVEIIKAIPKDEEVSLYKHGEAGNGEWVDVCEGPHVPRTGFLAAVKLTHVAGAYWRGDERNPMLQRIYGTAFPSKEALAEHLKMIEEAKARDHRKLIKELELVHFDQLAPAMPFFLPKGAYVYNALVDYVRVLYEKYGYEEVITPQIFDPRLFRTSGHLGNYNENMYRAWTEDQFEEEDGVKKGTLQRPGAELVKELQQESFAQKPMNCPSHCVIFGSRKRSYRELPWRVADFGRLHRYERGGVVHGLARVRSFCQDDAHIFCEKKQVPEEIESFIKLLYEVYNTFKFGDVRIKLALRPEKRIGSDEDWDVAEGALRKGLEAAGLAYEDLPNEGAFYGPKLEFHVRDALKRSWQLGTIQYDPNLPNRFELAYTGDDGKDHMPIMLHRAILGSLERFFAVYVEHCAGKFPVWLSPKQATVLTVSEKANEYARAVMAELREGGLRVDADLSADKLGAKVRTGQLSRVPYMLVVGPRDAEAKTVSVRSRDAGDLGAMSIAAFVAKVQGETRARS